MRKRILSLFIFVPVLMIGIPARAGDNSKIPMKYPIILVHGWAGSDVFLKTIPYFWGIRTALDRRVQAGDLEQSVFSAHGVDAFNTDDVRARQLRRSVRDVMALTGARRVNLVTHSMGGTTARCMVWAFEDMRRGVSSITTVAAPHRGTSAADLVLIADDRTFGAVHWIMDRVWARIVCGNDDSHFTAAARQLTPEGMARFNRIVKDAPGVAYFSYATMYHGWSPGILNNFLRPFYSWMKAREGDNDGVVPVSSMPWGEYRGCETGLYGVDHIMVLGQFFGFTPGFNAEEFYVKIARFLSGRGM